MKSMVAFRTAFFSAIGVIAPLSVIASDPPPHIRYSVTPLGSLGGHYTSVAALNDKTEVCGFSYNEWYESKAFLWSPTFSDGPAESPQMRVLDGGEVPVGAWPQGLNNRGDVVGDMAVIPERTAAFLWTPESGFENLGSHYGFFPSVFSHAWSINDNRHVAGLSEGGTGFLWTPDGNDGPVENVRMRLMPFAHPFSINAESQMAGSFNQSSRIAAKWSSQGAMSLLGTLDGGISEARDINRHGQIVGSSTVNGNFHAILWTPDGTDGPSSNPQMRDLGTLGDHSGAQAINEPGQVVGWWSQPDESNAFVWSDGEMSDLDGLVDPDLGIQFLGARDINNRGQILAEDHFGQAYILTPKKRALFAVLLAGTGGGWNGETDTHRVRNALARFPGAKPENLHMVSSKSEALSKFAAIRSSIEPGDLVLFHYSGHQGYTGDGSEPTEGIELFAIPSNNHGTIELDLANTGDEYMAINYKKFGAEGADTMTDDELTAQFAAFPSTVAKLAIMDGCFSGGYWGLFGNGSDAGDLDKVPNSALAASTEEDSLAYATPGGGGDFSAAVVRTLNALADTGYPFSFAEFKELVKKEYDDADFTTEGVIGDAPWLETGITVLLPRQKMPLVFERTPDFDANTAIVSDVEPPCGAPIARRPADASICALGTATFTVPAADGPVSSYQWIALPNSSDIAAFVPLVDGPSTWDGLGEALIAGANSPTLTIAANTTSGHQLTWIHAIRFRCVLQGPCGSFATAPAQLSICGADFNCDTIVEDSDFVIFVAAYNELLCPDSPDVCVCDLNGDGFVDDGDFVEFIQAYNVLLCA